MKTIDIARIAHSANKSYCECLGDDSQLDWVLAPNWQKESVINGVEFRLKNRNGTAEENHNNWLKLKREQGWKYGVKKNIDKKEHPCFIPYDSLPELQKVKDVLFINIVDCLKEFLE